MTSTQTPDENMEQAVTFHRSGRLGEAEILYRRVLTEQPNHSNALHLLGLLAFQSGKSDWALELIGRAISLNPLAADFHLNRGVVLDQIGRSQEAVAAFNQAISLRPGLPEAHANLGNALRKTGKSADAAAACRKAIELRPDYMEGHLNLGNAQQDLGWFDDAIASFEKVTQLRPDFAEGHLNLGNALGRRGRGDDAINAYTRALQLRPQFPQAAAALGAALSERAAVQGDAAGIDQAITLLRQALEQTPDYVPAIMQLSHSLRRKGEMTRAAIAPDEYIALLRKAISLQPQLAEAHVALGAALQSRRQWAPAAAAYRQALAVRPGIPESHLGLGNVLGACGQFESAAMEFREAIALRPEYADAFHGLGMVMSMQGWLDQAAASFRRAIALRPQLAQAHCGLGVVHSTLGEMDDAIACLRQAAALSPDDSSTQNNLGVALLRTGDCDQAQACYQRAVELDPSNAAADSNRVYSLYFHPGYDAHAILREHRLWNEHHGQPLAHFIPRHANDRSTTRRLRIGYVSPDFREHVVGWGLLPLLKEHHKQKFEVLCYSCVVRPDALTDQLRQSADIWRETAAMDDDELSALIQSDRIDILVDLSLHMANNRMTLFARKPAPVQLTYLGYCGTTGLSTMDYRFSDPHLDPPETDLSCYSEQTVHLPTSYWCYHPGGEAPDVLPLPASQCGHITFGCLNNFTKVSTAALDLFAKVLSAVPSSRLLLHTPIGSHRQRVLDQFASHGVAPERIELIPTQAWAEYMQTYQRIDIALDPIPHGGGITTCDAMWMGVPTVTLLGGTAVGRGGNTILRNVGLPELIAQSVDQYVDIAHDLANDQPRLSELRAGLRQRLTDSPIMDAKRFARDIEAAYADLWARWAGNQTEST